MQKNYSFSVILLLISINLFAQPIINLANFPSSYSAFAVDAYAPAMEEPIPTNWIGDAGPDQLWDFSTFQIPLCCAHTKAFDLVPLSSTLYASYFPSANYCYRIDTEGEGISYEYHKLTATTYELLGGGGNFGPNVYNPTTAVFQFPYEFNAQINNPDEHTVYDAYGTLIGPMGMGTFTNVIRKKTTYAGDSVEYYTWYNTNPYYIIAEAQVILDTTLFRIYMTTASGSMAVDAKVKDASLTVFPNPAKTELNLKLTNNLPVDKVIITDIVGKVVAEKTENLNTIDIQNLANGVYVLSVYSGKESVQTKFFKE